MPVNPRDDSGTFHFLPKINEEMNKLCGFKNDSKNEEK